LPDEALALSSFFCGAGLLLRLELQESLVLSSRFGKAGILLSCEMYESLILSSVFCMSESVSRGEESDSLASSFISLVDLRYEARRTAAMPFVERRRHCVAKRLRLMLIRS
jgi:hypothetical protein